MENLKISIITPSLNQGKFIEECIQSVLNQNYKNFEHIIIDACSTDNTLDVLKKYQHLTWISEKDKGQSDALNKGLHMASGDIIGWLNADDYYCSDTFNKISKLFNDNHGVRWIVGNLYNKYEILNKLDPLPFVETNYKNLKSNCDILRTQATFFKKDLIDEAGKFDTNLHMVMDYNMWLKMAKISQPYNLKEYLGIFRVHTNQKTTPKNYIKQYKELFFILLNEKAYIGLIRKSYTLFNILVKRGIKVILIYFKIIDKKLEDIPLRNRNIK
jgi:glycosyltransferase involved in cell wall biosynthesis